MGDRPYEPPRILMDKDMISRKLAYGVATAITASTTASTTSSQCKDNEDKG